MMDAATTASYVTLATLIVGLVFQIYRENRNRRWEKEDKAELAKNISGKVEETGKDIVRDTSEHLAKLSDEIQKNTEISTKAFHEANTVNLKLEKLGLAHNTQGAEQTAAVKELTEAVKLKKDS